jgi:Glycosyl hydrolase family 12/Stigma-specific protein, Stig1
MVSRPIPFLACVAVLGSALLMAGCAKPATGTGTTCSSGQMSCSGTCTNVQSDSQNCGACGNTCGSGSSCQAGACSCTSGFVSCGGSCVASNAQHCGSSCTACSGTDVCNSDGTCSSTCSSGTKCSDGACSSSTNSADCGSCGNACSGGTTCVSGTCSCGTSTQTVCNGSCVDITTTSNCGSCGNKCGSGQTCSSGNCVGGGSTGGTTGTGTGGSGTSTGGTTGTGTGGNGTGTGGSGTGTGGSGTGTGGSGTSTGGTTGTGGTSSAGDPPGYYKTADWNVTSVDWHGCVWTGIDSTVAGSTTSIMPQDFTAAAKEGGPYEVSGTVYNDYNAVALLGFNLNEAVTGSSTQCKYNAAAATQAGPPTATIPSSATGIAVNWSQAKAPPTSFRIQIQAADGATNANDRWCATITDAQGPSFIPFSSFYTQCWNVGTTMSSGTQYAMQAIDAVVFLVPGTMAEKAPFDFTVTGFAPGTSKSDAPGGAAACGTIAGTLGSSTASMTSSYQRAAVTGTDCHEYIIQNNNWGNPTGSTQIINYTGTSFTVQSSSGSGSSAPASFPSTYIGANGNIANGTYNTWSDSGLPKQISAMQSVTTNFAWSGGTSGGDFNATYDVWFADTPPTAGSYDDGVSGFLMVWLYKPSGRQPIGSIARTVTLDGHTWNVWVGPRGSTATGTGSASRPVISYVAQDSPVASLSFNLKDFISDAVTHADTNNGVSGPFSSSWYLTDVFAGFEIWTGSNATNLKSTGFSCVVK